MSSQNSRDLSRIYGDFSCFWGFLSLNLYFVAYSSLVFGGVRFLNYATLSSVADLFLIYGFFCNAFFSYFTKKDEQVLVKVHLYLWQAVVLLAFFFSRQGLIIYLDKGFIIYLIAQLSAWGIFAYLIYDKKIRLGNFLRVCFVGLPIVFFALILIYQDFLAIGGEFSPFQDILSQSIYQSTLPIGLVSIAFLCVLPFSRWVVFHFLALLVYLSFYDLRGQGLLFFENLKFFNFMVCLAMLVSFFFIIRKQKSSFLLKLASVIYVIFLLEETAKLLPMFAYLSDYKTQWGNSAQYSVKILLCAVLGQYLLIGNFRTKLLIIANVAGVGLFLYGTKFVGIHNANLLDADLSMPFVEVFSQTRFLYIAQAIAFLFFIVAFFVLFSYKGEDKDLESAYKVGANKFDFKVFCSYFILPIFLILFSRHLGKYANYGAIVSLFLIISWLVSDFYRQFRLNKKFKSYFYYSDSSVFIFLFSFILLAYISQLFLLPKKMIAIGENEKKDDGHDPIIFLGKQIYILNSCQSCHTQNVAGGEEERFGVKTNADFFLNSMPYLPNAMGSVRIGSDLSNIADRYHIGEIYQILQDENHKYFTVKEKYDFSDIDTNAFKKIFDDKKIDVNHRKLKKIRKKLSSKNIDVKQDAIVLPLLAYLSSLGNEQDEIDKLLKKGEQLYVSCVACHQEDGGGNKALNAPTIAGSDKWYLLEQLKKFKNGMRGAHEKDITGMQMAPMAKILETDEDMEAVATFVENMQAVDPNHVLKDGDLLNGKRIYTELCFACHGVDAKGNEALKSPNITNKEDWYMLEQLKKFRGEIRGSHPKDTSGMTMLNSAKILQNEQEMLDVITYIKNLK